MDAAPFFVVGSARSGTTLLRMILNAHPLVAVPPESRFVVELYEGREVVDAEPVLQALARHPRFRLWGLGIEEVRRSLPPERPLPYSRVMEAAYNAYAEAQGKSRWGDKTPRYVEHMDLLGRLWPRARFVHLVRDGRNVALSYADVPFGPKTVGGAARLWAGRVADGIAAGAALGGERYLQMRYEDLVEEPQARVKQLCDFLDIPFDEAMLSYGEQARSDVLDRARDYNPHVVRPPIRRVRSWEELMPDDQVEAFEAVAGDVLAELGYPRRFERPGQGARLRARMGVLGLPAGRLKARGAEPGAASDTDDETD